VIGVLPQDLMKDTNDRSQLQDGVANHFHEAMLVKFLKSNDEEMQECVVPTGNVECSGPYVACDNRYGARALAQSCKSTKQKRIVAKLEGAAALSKLMTHDSNTKLVIACLHALLNLSTEETNQAQIGRYHRT